MPRLFRSPTLPYLGMLLCSLLLLPAVWHGLGRPHLLPGTPTDGRLQCVSYSPFGKAQSPFDADFTPDWARIEADLAQLAVRFDCIRTYASSGLEALPALAARHGLSVLLGAWVSADPEATRTEIEALVRTARAHPQVVTAVIVGNEALLRKDITGDGLVRLIRDVKSRVEQPVTYADVWEFWLQYPQVAPAVDFVTIHLLPYWEDEPVAVDQALARVAEVRRRFGERFAPKDILIGETGWPSQGRQREAAVPSRLEQARFMRGFLAMAEREGWRYNLIEAYDQPWKRRSEGAVGGYWGLFDADRQDKGILAGPVSDLTDWPVALGAGALLMPFALLIAGRPLVMRTAAAPALAALAGLCLPYWGLQAQVISRYPGEWLWAIALLGLNALVLLQALLALSHRHGRRGRALAWLEARSHWWLGATGFAAAVSMLALVADGRYRDFPSAALVLPTLVYLLRPAPGSPREFGLLAALIGLGIPLLLYQETLASTQAIAWSGVSLLLVAALLRSGAGGVALRLRRGAPAAGR